MAYFDDTTRAMASLNKEVEQGGRFAEAAGTQFAKLSDTIFSLGNAAKVGAVKMLWDMITKAVSQIATITTHQLLQQKQQYITSLQEIEALRKKLATLYLSGEASREELDLAHETLELAVASIGHEKKRLEIATVFQKTIGQTLTLNKGWFTLAGLEITALSVTINQNHVLNQALMQANSAFKERYALTQKIFEVQNRTGAGSEALAESAQALVGYGLELRDSFKENVGLVTMLKEGLGVSASTGAELVVTFERGLQQSAKSVADVIANIAAQTGLAAQKAAQYAIELARALRLLGPMKVDAGGVAKAVEGIAARVEELGGNSQIVVSLYKQMLSGSNQGFMLRGLAGVPGPGSLGNTAGATAALEQLGRSMQRIITAGPGTTMYAAQLELAAQMHGIAAEDVTYYLEALKKLHEPLTEAQTLEKAYREQTQLTGEAWKQIGNSLSSLYKQVITPLLKGLAPIVRGLADFANMLVNTKGAVYVATTALFVGLGAATVAIWRLTKASWAFVTTSGFLDLIPGFKTLGTVIKSLPALFTLTRSAPTLMTSFGRAAGFMAGGMGSVTGGFGAAALMGLGGIVGAGAVGLGLGTLINRYLLTEKLTMLSVFNPLQWLKEIAKYTGGTYEAVKKSTYGELKTPLYTRAQNAANAIANLIRQGKSDNGLINDIMIKEGRGLKGKGLEMFPGEVADLVHKEVGVIGYVNKIKSQTTYRRPGDDVADKSLEAVEKTSIEAVKSTDLLKKIAKATEQREAFDQRQEALAREAAAAQQWLLLRQSGSTTNGPSYQTQPWLGMGLPGLGLPGLIPYK